MCTKSEHSSWILSGWKIHVVASTYIEVGGYKSLQTKYLEAIPDTISLNSTCGIPREDSFVLLREAGAVDSDMPWVGFLLGQTPASIWYWCADQMMVQRALSARSLSHAQGATIFAGYVKILPMFVLIIPGMISRVLYPNEIGCIDPAVCQEFCGQNSCTNFAYPKLVFDSMPGGMRGLMLSVMMSALITDLTSIFNSSSTLFTIDIWTLIFPNSTQKQKVVIGRLFIIVMVVLSLAWIPIIERTQGGQLYVYIQSIGAYLAPPIAAVYVLAISWSRMNEKGAFFGLMAGFLIGIPRMILDFSYAIPGCGEIDHRPAIVKNFHYMYFATMLFWAVIATGILVSLLTEQLPEWRLHRTTYSTRFDKRERPDEDNEEKDNNLFPIADENAKQLPQKSSPSSGGIKGLFVRILYGEEDSPESQIQQEAMTKRIGKLKDLEQKKLGKTLIGYHVDYYLRIFYFYVYLFFYKSFYGRRSKRNTGKKDCRNIS